MNSINIKKLKLIIPFLCLTLFVSCNDDDSNAVNKEQPTISIRLVDAPGDYEAVNVEIVDVMIKMNNDSDDDNGWISLDANNETVNLLDFTGGFSKVLVEKFPIPAGTLSQMRLVLGDGNTIVIKNENDEDETFELKTPSAQQSGLKLKVNTLIEEGFTYDFILDFDVEKSIVHAGSSGNIILKPVLYVSAETSSGIIEGTVSPNNVPSIVSVLIDDKGTPETDDDFVISAYTNETNGAFALWGVPAGNYEVIAKPIDEASDYSYGNTTDVLVKNGEITVIPNPIELMLKPGSIRGDVTNDIMVSVTVKDTNNNIIASIDSNETGAFLLETIPAGTYTVSISATGFVSQDIENVVVETNVETTLEAVTLVAV